MEGIVRGHAMVFTGEYEEEKNGKKTGARLPYHNLFVQERTSSGIVMQKIKVKAANFPSVSGFDLQHVEVLVEQKDSNFGGKQKSELHFLRGKVVKPAGLV